MSVDRFPGYLAQVMLIWEEIVLEIEVAAGEKNTGKADCNKML